MSDAQLVLIVGAGPTGLTAAHELARAGSRCRLVDKNAHRARESRAIAIHPRTVESFELMGLADDFPTDGQRITCSATANRSWMSASGPSTLATRLR
jgi:6-methylpretetramide 4-monooxygenase / 4-hydroxy-6-methylpretetramide 12a-monooxygenase